MNLISTLVEAPNLVRNLSICRRPTQVRNGWRPKGQRKVKVNTHQIGDKDLLTKLQWGREKRSGGKVTNVELGLPSFVASVKDPFPYQNSSRQLHRLRAERSRQDHYLRCVRWQWDRKDFRLNWSSTIGLRPPGFLNGVACSISMNLSWRTQDESL